MEPFQALEDLMQRLPQVQSSGERLADIEESRQSSDLNAFFSHEANIQEKGYKIEEKARKGDKIVISRGNCRFL